MLMGFYNVAVVKQCWCVATATTIGQNTQVLLPQEGATKKESFFSPFFWMMGNGDLFDIQAKMVS